MTTVTTTETYQTLVESDEQTCAGTPTQWEGTLRDGRLFYFRYRWGHASLRVHPLDPFHPDSLIHVMELGGKYDGTMDDAEYRRTFVALFARLAGEEV